ncbi:SemiSWEET family sugar transporter [Ohtaekwangia sp.]|uniref:SemiSWEET family sugar transporter n=1 Tax=Ohtaekwangia sp. TaxID=2066019 RepID=UPI002F94FF74
MLTEVIGIGAGACTALSLLPQLIKIIRDKQARDISLFYLIVLLAGLSLWIWYGILRDDMPIIVTNVTSIVLNIAIIILGIRYKKK